MKASLAIYHRLPQFARDLISSVHGRRLWAWRYGPETPGLVDAARARERWTETQWGGLTGKRLSEMLEWAATEIPYYRSFWSGASGSEGRAAWRELRNWPVLRKSELRRVSREFVHPGLASECRVEATSGSTGTPLELYLTRESCREWYALMESRWRGWAGVSRFDPWAILGGQLVTPVNQSSPPFWVRNSAMNQLYMSSYHISEKTWRHYMEALQKNRISHIIGYASSLYSLAVLAGDTTWEFPDLKCILSNAEPLFRHQRDLIQKVFGCQIRDTYGMSEMVCGASECEAGRLHLWPEVGCVEILEDGSDVPVEPGKVGRIVCTGFLNRAMPLIRYEIGDRGSLASPNEVCPCGRTMPVLSSIEGRIDDVLWTRDGRRVGRLDPVFKSGLPILEAQVVQESLGALRVLVVPDKGFGGDTEAFLTRAFRERLGDVRVEFLQVDRIPRGANGKFKTVVCKLNAEDLRAIGVLAGKLDEAASS